MKFINNFLFPSLAVVLSVYGCTNTSSTMSNINTEIPQPAVTNLTETLKCMGEVINNSNTQPVLLLVDDFYDGTVPIVTDTKARSYIFARENGPLADGGKYDFESIIKRTVPPKSIMIPYSLPRDLLIEDGYGRLSPDFIKGLSRVYGVKGVIRVKGVFTQNDSSDYYSKGFGANAGVDGKHGDGEIDFGSIESSKSISLAIHLGNAENNIIAVGTTLTLNTHTKSDEISVGVGYGEGSLSFAKEKKVEEGLHGAQRTLIEAAALWTLRALYQDISFDRCFDVNGSPPDLTIKANQEWLAASKEERIRYLKLMLKERNIYNGSINGRYDFLFRKSIRTYEKNNGVIIPYTENTLGGLFVQLYQKVDLDRLRKSFRIQNQL